MPVTDVVGHRHDRVQGLIDAGVRSGVSLLSGLTAYWALGEASGTRFDSLGVNNLSDNGGVGSATGIVGNGSSHTAASSQYLSVGGSLTANGVDRSLSMWVYPTNVSVQRGIASGGPAGAPLSTLPLFIVGYRRGGGSGAFYVYCGGGYRDGSTVAALNTWYHVVYTYNASSTNVGLWINGTREVNLNQVDSQTAPTLYIGSGFTAYHDGRIDEVGLWSRELTSTEIALLYNNGVGTSWPF
jgi:hypothetical protein